MPRFSLRHFGESACDVLVLALSAIGLFACEPKVYPDANPDEIATWEASTRDAGREASAPLPGSSADPVSGELGEEPPLIGGVKPGAVEPGSIVGRQSGAAVACEIDAGMCTPFGDGGVDPTCVPTGQRDCTSELDNDCDGQPDAVVDSVCVCRAGTVEACDEHPGLDGRGECRAGLRSCVHDEVTLGTTWGDCEGSIGPGLQDTCIPGDDTDCDGRPNEGCSCVDGETQPCGSATEIGPCQIGTSTCVGGTFGPCVGAQAPASRDSCSVANDDSNCNGISSEGCSCIDGQTQSCGSTDTGPCQRGTRTCYGGGFGQCVGAVNPAQRDSCSSRGDDSDCDGLPNDGCQCVTGDTRPCGVTDTGVCRLGSQTCNNGNFGDCAGALNPASRDCRSRQDNDCDGQPDDTIDNVCACSIGQIRACQTHPQDGVGRCRAGQQTCQAGPNNGSSTFGNCTGSVGPAQADSCTTVGDDSNCDGTRNGGCECVAGQGNGPCSDDPNNSRCNGQGQCVPCQSDADCSLVEDRQACQAGECVAEVEPYDCTYDPPPQCPLPPFTTTSTPAPAPTGGTIEDGTYVISQVRFYGAAPSSVPGDTLQFSGGFFNRNHTTYLARTGAALTGHHAAGTYVTTGTSLALEGIICSVGGTPRSAEIFGYTVSGSRLEIFKSTGGNVTTSIEVYARQ